MTDLQTKMDVNRDELNQEIDPGKRDALKAKIDADRAALKSSDDFTIANELATSIQLAENDLATELQRSNALTDATDTLAARENAYHKFFAFMEVVDTNLHEIANRREKDIFKCSAKRQDHEKALRTLHATHEAEMNALKSQLPLEKVELHQGSLREVFGLLVYHNAIKNI